MKRTNLLLIAALALSVTLPLFLVRPPAGGDEETFAGADTRAVDAIRSLSPDYKPWFSPVFKPPSVEVETMFFALQAALGAGLIGYYLGLMKGRAEGKARAADKPCT